jgi:hypothetical protein
MVAGLLLGAGADRSLAQDDVRPPDAQAIEAWIAELDSDRYEVRELATRQLAVHGHQALAQLAAAADSQRVEAAVRAIAVLEKLADTDDEPLKLEVLQRLADLENRAEARRRAQEKLAKVWTEISLPIVLEQGGRMDLESGFQFVDEKSGVVRSDKLILGTKPKWTGGDDGLAHVARLDFVTKLSVRRAEVTADGLKQLADMSSLQYIELYGMKFTDDELKELVEALPGVTFDVRSGAMLGVRGYATAAAAQVGGVEPGTGAEAAGLRVGDIIVKIDETNVASFTELTAEIAKRQPDQSAVLTIRRDDELIERKVTFGYWE